LYENKKLLDIPVGVISHTKNDGKVIYLLYGLDGFFYSNSKASDWFFMDAEKHQQLFSFDDSHMVSIMITEQGNPNRLKVFESLLLNTKQQINQLLDVTVFPNPSKNLIQISEPISQYSITSLEGKLLQTNTADLLINTIPISNLNSGIYILTISKGDKSSVHRIQIEN